MVKNKTSNDINGWVDVHDSELMIELGMHPNYLPSKDPSVWTKSKKEKELVKALKSAHKGEIHFGSIPNKSIPVRAKLIIQLKKNKKFPNTTYSTICNMNQIDNILSNYCQNNPKTNITVSLVAKYTYNGKTYEPNERPFWR